MNDETRTRIMDATRRVLCDHGNAGLTIQRIADESSLSTAAIHYHFDTKEELLDAFLDHLLDAFEAELACEATDPRERLRTFLETVFPDEAADDRLAVALIEIKAQAPFHGTYRERLTAMDRRMRGVVADAVRDGVAAGTFDDADPEEVARFVVTAINGAHVRDVALDEDPGRTRALIDRHLERELGWRPEVAA
jgi:AcrR family transcriptional regulator